MPIFFKIYFAIQGFLSQTRMLHIMHEQSPLLVTVTFLALQRPPGVRVVGLVAAPLPFEPSGFKSAHFSLFAEAEMLVFLPVAAFGFP